MSYADRRKQVVWTSPSGKKFTLETDGKIKYSRKRKGEVKNNPTRSYGKKIIELPIRQLTCQMILFKIWECQGVIFL